MLWVPFLAAVEGVVDEAVVKRLIADAGGIPGAVHGKNGKSQLRHRIVGYNSAARRCPWVVLVDLVREEECAPPLRQAWLPQPAEWMCFRVAVRETEAWLLVDHDRIARFLRVRMSLVPDDPEALDDPKAMLVDLARRSRKRDVREDMVPRAGSGRTVGPAYSSRLIEFATDRVSGWRPDVAATRADSLARCRRCLSDLAARWRKRN